MKLNAANLKKADLHLSSPIRYNGKVQSHAAMVIACVEAGRVPSTREEFKIKDMSRAKANRATLSEQYAHDKKQREAGMKTVYVMTDVDGDCFVDISKTQYEFACYYLSGERGESASPFFEVFEKHIPGAKS